MNPRVQRRWRALLALLTHWLKWGNVVKPLLALATVALLTTIVYLHLDFYQVGAFTEQFRVGQPAPRDIIAPHAMNWEDVETTEQARTEAAAAVPEVFAYDRAAYPAARRELTDLFFALYASPRSDEQETLLKEKKISQATLDAAGMLTASDKAAIRQVTLDVLDQVMAPPRRIEVGDAERDARVQADTMLKVQLDAAHHRSIAAAAISAVIRPTWVVDDTLTQQQRQAARDAVAPVVRQYKPGDFVLRKGDGMTESLLAHLKQEGLLTPAPLSRVAPIVFIVLFGVGAIGLYLRTFARPVYDNNLKLLLLASLLVTSLWAHMTFGAQRDHEYLVSLVAIPAGSMAIAGLLGGPTALITTLMAALTAGLTAHNQFAVVVLILAGSLAGVMAISAIWPASRAVPAVLALVGIDLLVLMSLAGLQPGIALTPFWTSLAQMSLWAAAGGVGSTIIAAGAIYLLARPFGITTYYRLMELSNPQEPLLRRMMTEAPGSYHSSVMVANMAEAAADAIGADALITRVGALYHDIGKLKRPAFFVENQAPLGVENVHARLSPKLSYLILASHVRDGIELGRKARLPEEVVNIIRQHHGTSLAAYFYHRALSEANGGAVSEHEFRYPGPKPSTREAAVVMLSDSVQASVKAIKEPTPSRIEHMVQEIITSRLDDHQLDDCDLTLRDLRIIGEVFTRILSGLYTYTRVEYPVVKGEGGARSRAYLNSEDAPPPHDAAVRTTSH